MTELSDKLQKVVEEKRLIVRDAPSVSGDSRHATIPFTYFLSEDPQDSIDALYKCFEAYAMEVVKQSGYIPEAGEMDHQSKTHRNIRIKADDKPVDIYSVGIFWDPDLVRNGVREMEILATRGNEYGDIARLDRDLIRGFAAYVKSEYSARQESLINHTDEICNSGNIVQALGSSFVG
ncbi:hypothetical protein H6503_00040 [Candidatus Woesearchaeota archaeon]|nr:hypothetical protein [Candidatus Woesearchaeota archaeon]